MATEQVVALAVASVIAAIAIGGLIYIRTRPQPTRFVSFEWRNQWTLGSETLNAAEIEEMKSGAIENFRAAFAGFGVVVTNGGGSNRILVNGFSGSAVGSTTTFALFSWVYYDDISVFARRYADERKIGDRREILRGIARGVGRVAAHEFGHQGVSGGFVFHDTEDPETYDYYSGERWQLYYGELHWSPRALERMRNALAH